MTASRMACSRTTPRTTECTIPYRTLHGNAALLWYLDLAEWGAVADDLVLSLGEARRLAVRGQDLAGPVASRGHRRDAAGAARAAGPAARSGQRRGAQPPACAVEQARRLRPGRPGHAAVAGALAVRVLGARRLDRAHRGLPDPPRHDAGVPHGRESADAGLAGGERGLPPVRAGPAAGRRAATGRGHRGSRRRELDVDRLDQRPERRPDARLPVEAGYRHGCRPGRAAPPVGARRLSCSRGSAAGGPGDPGGRSRTARPGRGPGAGRRAALHHRPVSRVLTWSTRAGPGRFGSRAAVSSGGFTGTSSACWTSSGGRGPRCCPRSAT